MQYVYFFLFIEYPSYANASVDPIFTANDYERPPTPAGVASGSTTALERADVFDDHDAAQDGANDTTYPPMMPNSSGSRKDQSVAQSQAQSTAEVAIVITKEPRRRPR